MRGSTAEHCHEGIVRARSASMPACDRAFQDRSRIEVSAQPKRGLEYAALVLNQSQMQRLLVVLLAQSFVLASCASEADEPLPLTDAWSMLPVLDGVQHREWSSFERGSTGIALFAHSNKDFNNFLAVCSSEPLLTFQHADQNGPCEPPQRGYLIAQDDDGPGVVSRMYFTAGPLAPPSTATFRDEVLRIYVDDQPQPFYEGKLSSWRGGDPTFRVPLARYTSGALVSYLPIPYEKRLRILLDDLRPDSMYYYQIGAHQRVRPAESRETLAFLADNAGQVPGGALSRTRYVDQPFAIAAGQGVDVVALERSGTLQLSSFSYFGADESVGRDVRLQLFWNGAKHPSLDLPLETLFAGRHKLRGFRTLPMLVDLAGGRTTLTITLPMPYKRGARVRLHNAGQVPHTVQARIEGTNQVPAGPFGELRATWLEQHGPFTPLRRFRATNFRGRGKFIGVMMFIDGRGKADGATPHPVSFLEGDATTIVDGHSFQGTGTEDYFNAGFYFQDGQYDSPFSALVRLDANLEKGTSEVTAVRWHVFEDAIEFEQGFELRFEYGSYEPLAAHHYAALGFYYAP